MEASLILGVSQKAIENEYYMIDLPALIERKTKYDAVNRLADLRFVLATNNRSMEDSEYKRYVNELTTRLGIKVSDKFDRGKFEQLRALTQR
jgi:uncharacterized NAD-dependent epimerase/dehydratase family protein